MAGMVSWHPGDDQRVSLFAAIFRPEASHNRLVDIWIGDCSDSLSASLWSLSSPLFLVNWRWDLNPLVSVCEEFFQR